VIRRRLAVALIAVLALVLAACGGGGGDSSSGPTEIAVWHGYQDTEGDVFKGLVAQYNKDHPDVKVSELYSSNDLVLQKVLTAVRGDSAPDVAYMFGSWSPNIAKIPQIVDMKDEVAKPDWKWDDFYQAERDAATVGDKIVGVPALVDNLAIVYNKKLFADAGVAPPNPNWTWDDFRAAAAKLTDPAKGQFGWLLPADGSEDTVWHYAPMLWEAGGDILSPDNTKAVFNSEAGVKALTVLQQMAVTDKSLYLDTTNENGPKLMNSGKVAMLVTGPWDLSSLPDIDYDVQVMPTFAGSDGGHQTIAGPDNWVVFNNGDKKKQAAIDFVKWLTAPEQVKAFSLGTGDLPIRTSVGQDKAVLDKLNENVPGTAAFVENLNNVKKVRPQVEQYPAISESLGQAIVSVMLGKEQPKAALDGAAQAADAKLAEK
jgi:multiple sugar transport system substrate-binding protein